MTSDEGLGGPAFDENDPVAEEPTERPPEELVRADHPTAPEDTPASLWNRRTFFKTAALGTAAAAMYEGGRAVFSPLVAYANDLSHLPCTANDVQIIGTGIVVNEPCDCTGTFDAQVVFTVRNITSTDRFCISVHLADGRDILLEDASGSSTAAGKDQGEDFKDTVMTGILEDFPCGAGLVCFGQEGVTRGKCDPGTCSTVAWSTNQGAADCESPDESPPGGQCRHQQICIQGRGNTTLDCDLSTTAIEESCAVVCGTSTTLRLCTTSPVGLGPFTFTLSGGGVTYTPQTSPDQCAEFLVGPITATTVFTGTVTDRTGCARSDSVTLTTTQPAASIAVAGNTNCNGVLTLTASVAGSTGCSFTWTEGATTLGTGPTRSYGPVLDGVCHTINVAADLRWMQRLGIGEYQPMRRDHGRLHAVGKSVVSV